MSRYAVAFLLNLIFAALAIALIWEADLRAYWVWPTSVADTAAQRARLEPAKEVLETIGAQQLGLSPSEDNAPAVDPSETVRLAERFLGGYLEFHRNPPIPVAVPFTHANFLAGSQSAQLFIAGLGPVNRLLRAYRASGDQRFLRTAVEEIIAFERVDRYSLAPSGFQWNDHAMANSISVLADAWSLIRSRSDTGRDAEQALLRLASRTAMRLAKPDLYTFRTNHGIMQNLALLQFAAAFPTLESARPLGDLGCERLRKQMRYYVSDEGVVLEHSAGYHEFGRQLLDKVLRLSELGGDCRPPAEWAKKHEATHAFSALLWRPDRSLPVFGNTDGARSPGEEELRMKPGNSFSVLPVSGYAVWWSGLAAWPNVDRLAQTIVTWSNFPTRAHKHADDLGVLVWSRGVPWITSVGYWPYDAAGYADVQSWLGANAPHFVDEPGHGTPLASLIGVADAGRLHAIALERVDTTGTATLRRQIIELDGSTWLIADSVAGSRDGEVTRLWTFASGTDWASPEGQDIVLTAKNTPLAARMTTLGDVAAPPKQHRGQTAPFVGWNVVRGAPVPAPAVSVVQRGPRSMVVSVLQVDDEKRLRTLPAPRLSPNSRPDDWSVVVHTPDGPVPVSWNSSRVSAGFPQGDVAAALSPQGPGAAASRLQIVSAYGAMGAQYQRFRELTPYRHRLTGVVAAIFVILEVVLLILRRRLPAAVLPVRLLGCLFWPVFGTYCAFVFLT